MMTDPLALSIRGCMTQVLSALSPSTSIAAAIHLLRDQHLSGAPVVDASGRLLGIVSLTDLAGTPPRPGRQGTAHYYVMHGGKPQTEVAIPGAPTTGGVVEDVMSRTVLTLPASAPLREAARTMVTMEVHRVLITDGEILVGLISTMDVLRQLVEERPAAANQGF